jgi:hypothetical protein
MLVGTDARPTGLVLEPPQRGPVGTEPRVHDLQRDPFLERSVLGVVDYAHTAVAQFTEQRLVAQPLRVTVGEGRLDA